MTETLIPLATKLRPEEKEEFQRITAAMGTTPSNALRMFVAAFNKRGGFPFDLSNPYGYNRETLEAMHDAATGQNLVGPFPSVDAMMKTLLADDTDDDA